MQPHSRILLSYKKEWVTDTHRNMDSSQMPPAKQKEPHSKDTWCGPIYMTFWKRQMVGMVVLHLKRMKYCKQIIPQYIPDFRVIKTSCFCFSWFSFEVYQLLVLVVLGSLFWNCLMEKCKYWKVKNRFVTSKYVLRRLMHFFSFWTPQRWGRKCFPYIWMGILSA